MRTDPRVSPFHRTRLPGPWLLAACTALAAVPVLAALATPASPAASSELLAFPGAVGWAAHTPGGNPMRHRGSLLDVLVHRREPLIVRQTLHRANPDEWRQHTSHAITFSNNILAEGLANATHAKGEHSKGSLIHDNVTDILIIGNLYAHDAERNPLFKGGVHGQIVNNLIYDPGQGAVHYNLIAAEWGEHPFQVGKISLVGNVMRAGPSTPNDVALFELGGAGDVELYMKDNIAVDRIGRPLPMLGRYTTSAAKIIEMKPVPRCLRA